MAVQVTHSGLKKLLLSIFSPPFLLFSLLFSSGNYILQNLSVLVFHNQERMVSPDINLNNLTIKSTPTTIKFLCSYGGKIVLRYPDGKLRYHGGETRVLSIDRSVTFTELLVKLGEMCGASMSLRCQLPTEDLDALVSITSDEDLANLIEEYDRAASPTSSLKIRAFLSTPKSIKKVSPTPSVASSSSNDAIISPKSVYSANTAASLISSRRPKAAAIDIRCINQNMSKPVVHPLCYEKPAANLPRFSKTMTKMEVQLRIINPSIVSSNWKKRNRAPGGGSTGKKIRLNWIHWTWLLQDLEMDTFLALFISIY